MAVTLEQFGLDRLPSSDRVQLLDLLWDSMEQGELALPEWHRELLEQRIAAADADPAAGIDWQQFKAKWFANR